MVAKKLPVAPLKLEELAARHTKVDIMEGANEFTCMPIGVNTSGHW